MRPITATVGPLVASSANAICLSQTPSSTLTLNGALVTGGVAVLDTPRNVLITTTADESAKSMTFTGTTFAGNSATETITLPNNTTKSTVLDFKTVTAITISSAASSALTIGTGTTAGSAWVYFDPWGQNYISIQANVSGTTNYTIQATLDDPNSPTNSVAIASVTWFNSNDTTVVSATASKQSNFGFTPTYARVLMNSGTTGFTTTTFLQSGGVIL